jgi:hypothetical protein
MDHASFTAEARSKTVRELLPPANESMQAMKKTSSFAYRPPS